VITENVKRKVSVVGSDPKAIKKLFLEELHEEVTLYIQPKDWCVQGFEPIASGQQHASATFS
jgi:hypothetical protein